VHHTRALRKHTPGDHDLVDGLVGSSLRRLQAYTDARPEVTSLQVLLLPPAQKYRIALGYLVDRPVKLGRVIVDPPLVEP